MRENGYGRNGRAEAQWIVYQRPQYRRRELEGRGSFSVKLVTATLAPSWLQATTSTSGRLSQRGSSGKVKVVRKLPLGSASAVAQNLRPE